VPPVLRTTLYDRVSSWLMSLVVGLVLAVTALGTVWVLIQPARKQEPVPVEFFEEAGGVEDGSVDETLELESPAPEAADASLAEVESTEPEIQETLDNVLELADQATMQAERTFELDARNAGTPGSSEGTGRRALGLGPGKGGVPREQRWFISYGSEQDLAEYARQLDYFQIELGALLPDRRLVYISELSEDKPKVRFVQSGKDEQRLYMTWQGGQRKAADIRLFHKAGIDASNAIIFQFYPKPTEDKLAALERTYRNKPVDSIRRTYFVVVQTGRDYEFKVTRQVYFQ
jgi:hypothetical protein